MSSLAGRWVWPVAAYDGRAPVVSDGFYSPRPGVPQHGGVDIMFRRAPGDREVAGTPNGTPNYVMPNNTAVLAASDGVVWSAGPIETGGAVVIDHGPRKAATFYAHLASVNVAKGDRVSAGDAIGTVGGNPQTSDALKHLHFELWLGGPDDRIDPQPDMQSWEVVSDPRGGFVKLALIAFVAWGGYTLWKTRRQGGSLW